MKFRSLCLGTTVATAFLLVLIPANAAGNMSGSTNSSSMMEHKTVTTVKGVPLNAVHDASKAISNASVEDSMGATVGKVASVTTWKSGRVRAVKVSLTSPNKTVAIPAADLRFDKSSDTLDARLSRTAIDRLPSS